MGKQSKRQNRRKAQDRAKQREANLAAANALENPLQGLDRLLFTKDIPQANTCTAKASVPSEEDRNPNLPSCPEKGNLEIQYFASPLPSDLHDACMLLFQANMGELYEKSEWGLDLQEKAEELRHEHARFLIVTPNKESRDLVAFVHFRFDVNDDDQPTEEVLYVYEIQVSLDARRFGLGKRLMNIMELVGTKTYMRKVMLTVFSNNHAAMKFYKDKLKYVVDENSPSRHGQTADYEILSKVVSL